MKKWLLFYCFIACFLISSIHSKPFEKRQDDDFNDLHHVTTTTSATRTSRTRTSTGTWTSTPTTGSDNNNPPIINAGGPNWNTAVYGTETGISPQMASLGAILIALGLFLCSFGFRLSKIMLGVMGLLTFGSVTWIALANCKPESGYSRDAITMIVVPVGVGVVGAAICYVFWAIAMYLAGAFGGFVLAIFICSWRSDLVIVNLIGRSAFLGGLGLLCAIIVYFKHRPIMFFTTSFVGAYIVMFGVDCLARVGFIAGPEAMLNRNPRNRVEYSVTKYVYVLLGMVLALFFISIVWQFIFNAAYEFGLHVAAAVKGKEAHAELHREEAAEDEAVRDVVDGSSHHG